MRWEVAERFLSRGGLTCFLESVLGMRGMNWRGAVLDPGVPDREAAVVTVKEGSGLDW